MLGVAPATLGIQPPSDLARDAERRLAGDGDTVHEPALIAIVGRRIVRGGAVVPERDIPVAPLPPHDALGLNRVRVQQPQDGLALRRGQTEDSLSERLIDEQPALAGL